MKYGVLCNIPRNVCEMPKYVEQNSTVTIRGSYYFLGIFVVRNEMYLHENPSFADKLSVLEAYSALSFRNHGSLLRQPGI
jgi:hypothetical protein